MNKKTGDALLDIAADLIVSPLAAYAKITELKDRFDESGAYERAKKRATKTGREFKAAAERAAKSEAAGKVKESAQKVADSAKKFGEKAQETIERAAERIKYGKADDIKDSFYNEDDLAAFMEDKAEDAESSPEAEKED